MFETFIVQPIYNLLLFIYANVPGNDFGFAVIIFTIAIRFVMWPMLKKQLHQSRVMREIQPQIKEIKKKAKGNRQLEAQMLMELYREKGVNPLASLGSVLFVQLPVFLGLFSALRALMNSPTRIITLPYSWIRDNPAVHNIMEGVAAKTTSVIQGLSDTGLKEQLVSRFSDSVSVETLHALPKEELNDLFNKTLATDGASLVQGPFFDQHLTGIVDLSRNALEGGAIYWPLMVIALIAAVLQFMQTRQLMPKKTGKQKSIRQILKESAKGKQTDQSEINAAVGSRTAFIFAPLIFYISAISPGGLAVYFATSGAVGYIQQRLILRRDVNEMEEMADKQAPTKKKNKKKSGKKKRKR